ncbi:hypothetical protein DPMN_077094 [Dreissena polymorpha]|uniref:Uncharacterized protein n=1 Tax=Dreissena polymorpha TaxID=45954 RepID=A0A9D4BR19_DREPO|nr:hypothetical protein DPMN_077094 [Dreissena polymorpha]
MCWLGILGMFIVLYKSTHAEIYNISGYSTEWRNANCTKAEPILSYNNFVFAVNETIGKLATSDVWIGYFKAKVPFYFHGCAVVQNEQTYPVTRIGYCKSICVNTTLFGIQTTQGHDIFNPEQKAT